jgi:hypothetical protein
VYILFFIIIIIYWFLVVIIEGIHGKNYSSFSYYIFMSKKKSVNIICLVVISNGGYKYVQYVIFISS